MTPGKHLSPHGRMSSKEMKGAWEGEGTPGEREGGVGRKDEEGD